GANSGLVSGYLPEPLAREIYGDPRAVTGGVFAPFGTATPAGDAYRVSGRWPFASGSEHCTWLMGGALVRDGGPPRARMMLFPAADVRIVDTWTVSGLRGTGSHDMTVEDVLVPAERGVVQAEVAQAEALVRAGRAFLDDAIDRAWERAASDGAIGVEERVGLRLAATHATTSAARAV